jgi:hypothetical protein
MRVLSFYRARFLRVATVSLVATVALVGLPEATPSDATSSGVWTAAVTPSPAADWQTLDFANGQWIALSNSGEEAMSQNASTWSEYPVPTSSWQTVAYGNDQYVALSSDESDPEEMVSTDGVNWTVVAGPAGEWTDLVFDQGRFVAVSTLGEIVTSTNGRNWSVVWNHSKWDLTSITYGNGHFVAVDSEVGSTLISRNGINWSLYPPVGTGMKWGAVTYGNGTFVAFDESGSGFLATSVYGYDWTLHRYAPAEEITSAAFGCGEFLASGATSGSNNAFLSSSNGATWTGTSVPADPSGDWTAVSYGAHKYVAVDSAGSIAWTNSSHDCAAEIPTTPRQVSGNVAGGQVWTYMHPSARAGGSPVTSYRVTITNGSVTRECTASVTFQPNCIIRGLADHEIYWVSTQAHNRFGFSAFTDPEFVIPVPKWTLSAETAHAVASRSGPIVVQVTGVLANSEGIYPVTVVTIHFGAIVERCRPNPFGECLVSISNPPLGTTPIYADYSGYGRSYTSPISHVTVTP